MPESFPTAPGAGDSSFPRGYDPREEAVTQDGNLLLFRRYRVLRELGRGGMGVVLLAHDTALDINVAVKLVPDLVVKDTEAISDLRREVLRGMALMHPGIVRTHNFEKDEDGAGIVMEFVEGDTLTDLKVAQPGGCFDARQILPWIEQLCSVLDYAHREARLVHRDLKPRNLMVSKSGKLKVADFGIAALINDSVSRHSMEGQLSGTLSYMSPQQAEGQRPSVLDDIHALGASIYELLTSKPPYFRGNQTAIYHQILTVTPPPMTVRREELDIHDKLPIPSGWEEAIAACLAKDPAERPQSAGEVLVLFRGLRTPRADAVPIPAPALEVPTVAQTTSLLRGTQSGRQGRRRWVLAAAAGFVAVTTGFVVMSLRDPSRVEPASTAASTAPRPPQAEPSAQLPSPPTIEPEPFTPLPTTPAPSESSPAPAIAAPAPAPAFSPAALRTFCATLQSDEQSQDVDRILTHYAPTVNYLDQGTVAPSVIREDKKRYFQRWPKTTYALRGEVAIVSAADTTCEVRFQVDYSAENKAGERVAGIAEETLQLALFDGAARIVDEKSRILSRDTSSVAKANTAEPTPKTASSPGNRRPVAPAMRILRNRKPATANSAPEPARPRTESSGGSSSIREQLDLQYRRGYLTREQYQNALRNQ